MNSDKKTEKVKKILLRPSELMQLRSRSLTKKKEKKQDYSNKTSRDTSQIKYFKH